VKSMAHEYKCDEPEEGTDEDKEKEGEKKSE
jgi:hypothetical protein